MEGFSHLDELGRPAMVDVTAKSATNRTAVAQSIVELPEEVMQKFSAGGFHTPKGAVLQVAIIAGIMAAKKTGDLIPLCHPLGLENCHITIQVKDKNQLVIECTASITAKTGVEMEALVGASIAALTVYDMCKALSHQISIKETRLIKKTGGKHDLVNASL